MTAAGIEAGDGPHMIGNMMPHSLEKLVCWLPDELAQHSLHQARLCTQLQKLRYTEGWERCFTALIPRKRGSLHQSCHDLHTMPCHD